MATFETLPRFEASWLALTQEQRAMFRKVVLEAFEPDLAVPGRPFRPALRVREMAGCPQVFEVTWSDDGRATFSYGAERVPGQPHVIWRQIGSFARRSSSRHPAGDAAKTLGAIG
jgi:hypothetical protein